MEQSNDDMENILAKVIGMCTSKCDQSSKLCYVYIHFKNSHQTHYAEKKTTAIPQQLIYFQRNI